METALVVLYRSLEAMGLGHLCPAAGDTEEQRLDKERQVQFAIYLMQELAGVDIGYHFRWGTRPSSDSLHRSLNRDMCKELQSSIDKIQGVMDRLKARERAGIFGKKEMHAESLRNLEESVWRIRGALERLGE
jgi:hypothetical protein